MIALIPLVLMIALIPLVLIDAQAYNNSYFGEKVGQIKLHQVNCVGDESALLDCRHAIDFYYCYYYQAAGVNA